QRHADAIEVHRAGADMKIAISSGHGAKIPGAIGIIDEHKEAVRVVDQTAVELRRLGAEAVTFEDKTSTTQQHNLRTIVDWHNRQSRDYDVSIHFNAYIETDKGMGTETLYYSQAQLASEVSKAVSTVSGLINRGAKKRTDLYFLNNTNKPAILEEVCFVDSTTDVGLYERHFDGICQAIAVTLAPAVTPSPVPDEDWRPDITATVFAGAGDPQDSAYGWGKIDPNKPGVALPY